VVTDKRLFDRNVFNAHIGQDQSRQFKPVARKVFGPIVAPEYPPGPQAGSEQDGDGNNDDENYHVILIYGWSFRLRNSFVYQTFKICYSATSTQILSACIFPGKETLYPQVGSYPSKRLPA